MGERTILDALDRGQRTAVGGRSGRRARRLPGLSWAAGAVGVRALARGADARRGAVAQTAAGVLSWLWSYACAVSVVVGPVPARRGGGDRRGVALGCWWRRASPDRRAVGPSAGDGPRVAARRQSQRGQPASVRDRVGGLARSGACRCHCGRQRARRRGRGGHARRPCVGAAVRSRADRPVGASSVADRRVAVRPAGRAAPPCRLPGAASRPPVTATREWLASLASATLAHSQVSRTSASHPWASDHQRKRSGLNARRTPRAPRPGPGRPRRMPLTDASVHARRHGEPLNVSTFER
jgi:hypothetical protein